MATRRPPTTSGPLSAGATVRLHELESANEALAARVVELEAHISRLNAEAERNEAVLRRTHERELELLGAATLQELLELLVIGLRDSYGLETVSLLLQDPRHEIRHLLAADQPGVELLPDVLFVDAVATLAPQLAGLDRPWLGPWRAADHELLFRVRQPLGSIAILPMRREGQLIGAMILGSADPRRFTRELASDFLAHLAGVAALCVENGVNRARLMRSGVTDYLTGAHNRRYLEDRLREELARAQRTGTSVTCLMIDVDHFKRINDGFGHLAGDNALREIVQRIEGVVRASDTGARFGGDEFAIVLPDASTADGERLAARVLAAVKATPVQITPEASGTITVSIGIATARPDGSVRDFKALAERLVAEADAALYAVKAGGRDHYLAADRAVS